MIGEYNGENFNKISPIKNPFEKNCIESVFFHIHKNIFPPHEINFTSSVKFKNGNTNGEQKFKEKDFETLLKNTISFINTI
jgi:hypothetical protein